MEYDWVTIPRLPTFPAFSIRGSTVAMSAYEVRQEIVRLGKLLYEKGFIAASDGNISVRMDDRHVLATPTCMCKGMMSTEDLVTIDMQGRRLEGFREASSEIGMHLMIYRIRPDVKAIVHAHPTTATGFAAAGIALDKPLVSEVVLALGSVPLAKYATPGSQALCDSLEPLVADHNAILMANHGVVTYAEDLLTAYMNMETVEHFAKISLTARLLGREQVLDEQQVADLMQTRKKLQAAKMALTKRD
jgi:L-fuculose-phosphate aldolase